MRRLLLLVAALAASGCGLLGSLGRYDLPRAVKMLEHSKVNDTGRNLMHSNDPIHDKY